MTAPDPVAFFERQFQRQIRDGDFALNPFEQLALPHVAGSVLDLGCGLGNFSLEAARRGCTVTAVDASASAVERLPLQSQQADLASFRIEHDYDTVVAIGLLMFFRSGRALALLRQIGERVRPDGRAAVYFFFSRAR
jgi:tellurite methyltransferase